MKFYGIITDVFRRNTPGFTSSGITSKHDRVMLVLSQTAVDILARVKGTGDPTVSSWSTVEIDEETGCLLRRFESVGVGVGEHVVDLELPALRVEVKKNGYLVAEPIGADWVGRRLMFGGNFIYSSDSRFRALSSYPIPVHDRARKRA